MRPRFTIRLLMILVAIVALGAWIYTRFFDRLDPIAKVFVVALFLVGSFDAAILFGLFKFLNWVRRRKREAKDSLARGKVD